MQDNIYPTYLNHSYYNITHCVVIAAMVLVQHWYNISKSELSGCLTLGSKLKVLYGKSFVEQDSYFIPGVSAGHPELHR